jgi:hypothetical protein
MDQNVERLMQTQEIIAKPFVLLIMGQTGDRGRLYLMGILNKTSGIKKRNKCMASLG